MNIDNWANTIKGMIDFAFKYNDTEKLEEYTDKLHENVEYLSFKDDKSYELHVVEKLADYCEDKLYWAVIDLTGFCEVEY